MYVCMYAYVCNNVGMYVVRYEVSAARVSVCLVMMTGDGQQEADVSRWMDHHG